MPRTLYLIDGHSHIMRAHWSRAPDLTAPSGEPTKATFVFSAMLLDLARAHPDAYVAVAMDRPEGPTRRLAAFAEYKAGRDRMPEVLVPQIARIRSILELAGIPVLTCAGEEADDVIATVVDRCRELDVAVRILSRDKDLFQLLGPGVELYDPQDDTVIDAERLQALKGFTPAQAIEIQTLSGDPVDNVPGIPGVGPKKALDLVARYGTAEAVVAHAGELTPKLGDRVRAFAPSLSMTRALVTLRRDCPIEFDIEACRIGGFSLGRLAPVFQELRFAKLLPMLGGEPAPPAAPAAARGRETAADYRFTTAVSDGELRDLAAALGRAREFAVDTETTSLRPRDARLAGISFAWEPSGAVYVPLLARDGRTASLDAVREILGPLLADPGIAKCGQNIKYDIQTLRGAGMELAGIVFDTMVASYLLDAERRSHGLDALAAELLAYECIPFSSIIGSGGAEVPITEADPARLAVYGAEDANVTFRLWRAMAPRIRTEGFGPLFDDVEMPLCRVLADMEWEGVKIDAAVLGAISVELAAGLDSLRRRITDEAGIEFNVDSPKQLGEVLFDRLGLPVVKRTKSARSTDAEVLAALAPSHPLPKLVLEYRELAKLKNTYVDVLPELVSPATGRLHPSYHQTVAATGRLSSSDPNIQNIPVRTPEGKRIRTAFVPGRPGDVLIAADYSQIELRVLAHYSGDPAMRAAFDAGEDIHRWVASAVWGLPLAEVPSHLRSRAKAVNFGIIYGQTAFGLARALGIPRSEAAAFIAAYKEKFKGIAAFVERAVAEARGAGAVRTILGRRRPIAFIDSRNRAMREQAERLAVNTIIQGSAADLIKVAMVRLARRIREERLPARLIIQVHDELIFEAPERAAAELREVIAAEMRDAIPLSVPLSVDIASGPNWSECKP